MSLSLQPITKKFATNTQFDFIPMHFTAYKTDAEGLDKIYLDNTSPYTWTAVGTGTVSTSSNIPPKAGDKYKTIYNPSHTSADIPLVDKPNLTYTTITAAAINDGAKIIYNRDLSNANYNTIVISSSQASVSGKLKLRETGTQEVILSFTTSSDTNTWTSPVFRFKEDSVYSDVTAGAGGMPDFSAITELEITLDSASTDVNVAMHYTYTNEIEKIGSILTVVDDCKKEIALESSLDMTTSICNNLESAAAGTARPVEFKVTTEKSNLSDLAIANGQVLTQKTKKVLSLYSNDSVNVKTISAGAITVEAGLKIASVYVDGNQLYGTDTATNIKTSQYYYNGTTISFNTALNGKNVRIYTFTEKTGAGFALTGLKLGAVGYMVLPRQSQNGLIEQWVAEKVQLMQTNETFGADEFATVELTYKVYPNENKEFITRLEV